jgi:hypothetical protein
MYMHIHLLKFTSDLRKCLFLLLCIVRCADVTSHAVTVTSGYRVRIGNYVFVAWIDYATRDTVQLQRF